MNLDSLILKNLWEKLPQKFTVGHIVPEFWLNKGEAIVKLCWTCDINTGKEV